MARRGVNWMYEPIRDAGLGRAWDEGCEPLAETFGAAMDEAGGVGCVVEQTHSVGNGSRTSHKKGMS